MGVGLLDVLRVGLRDGFVGFLRGSFVGGIGSGRVRERAARAMHSISDYIIVGLPRREVLKRAFLSKTTKYSPDNSCNNDYHSQRKRQPEGGFSQAANSRVSLTLVRLSFGMMLRMLCFHPRCN